MTLSLIAALLLVSVFSIAAAVFFRTKERIWASLVIVGAIIAAFTAGSSAYESVHEAVEVHEAAHRQGIIIDLRMWQHAPYTTSPCELDLWLDTSDKTAVLRLEHLDVAANPEVIKVICENQ